uniref:Zeatin O-glucosyltransferase-like n=1 Tax=Nicotiana sylvestris TaxID=4096 RepID=A0A1U7WPU5_NICSY|nr:PREDICTED: zeatin O-glucosyltransferase-like [Nicotiana sylvestris]
MVVQQTGLRRVLVTASERLVFCRPFPDVPSSGRGFTWLISSELNADPVAPPTDVAEILQELASMEPGSDSPPPLMVKYVEKQMSYRANIFAENNNGSIVLGPLLYQKGMRKEWKEEARIVERGWAPQLEVLGHASTGVYLCHCGWNSVMESISMGVPIAAWPLHTDHRRTALLLIKGLKIGMYVRDWARRNELVKAETIHNAVKTLMDSPEGEKLRQKAAELKDVVKA